MKFEGQMKITNKGYWFSGIPAKHLGTVTGLANGTSYLPAGLVLGTCGRSTASPNLGLIQSTFCLGVCVFRTSRRKGLYPLYNETKRQLFSSLGVSRLWAPYGASEGSSRTHTFSSRLTDSRYCSSTTAAQLTRYSPGYWGDLLLAGTYTQIHSQESLFSRCTIHGYT